MQPPHVKNMGMWLKQYLVEIYNFKYINQETKFKNKWTKHSNKKSRGKRSKLKLIKRRK